MPLWRIQPVPDPEDGRRLDHTVWRKVVVRAPTAAVARHAAARMASATGGPPAGTEMPSAASFRPPPLLGDAAGPKANLRAGPTLP